MVCFEKSKKQLSQVQETVWELLGPNFVVGEGFYFFIPLKDGKYFQLFPQNGIAVK